MKDTTAHPLVGWVAGVICLVGGIYIFLHAHKIQQDTLDYYARNPIAKKLNPFGNLTEKPSTVLELRIWGIVMIIVALFLFFVLTFNYNPLPTW
jgi:hypothetical protein